MSVEQPSPQPESPVLPGTPVYTPYRAPTPRTTVRTVLIITTTLFILMVLIMLLYLNGKSLYLHGI